MRREALLDYLVQGHVGGAEQRPGSASTGCPPAQCPDLDRRATACGSSATGTCRRNALRDGARLRRRSSEWVDRVVADRLVLAEVPLGAFLSGGIDSNAVAHSMKRSGDGRAAGPVHRRFPREERTTSSTSPARPTAEIARRRPPHRDPRAPTRGRRWTSCRGSTTSRSPTPRPCRPGSCRRSPASTSRSRSPATAATRRSPAIGATSTTSPRTACARRSSAPGRSKPERARWAACTRSSTGRPASCARRRSC